MKIKPIAIIDCYAHSQAIEAKLSDCLDRLRGKHIKTMLVTNTPVEKKTADKLDYLLFDKENRLFDDTMEARHISLAKHLPGMTVVEVVRGTQRHGLSVLRNLNKALHTAKAYGYTHFHRVEVDDIMGDESMRFVADVPALVNENGKSGLFFLNDNPNESNISFHYMYCEIDLFLQSIRQIETQEDYQDYLLNEMNSRTFMNVEEFVRHNINKIIERLVAVPGSEMQRYFPDTIWNTETSQSNLESKYKDCTTRMYRIIHRGQETENRIILTYNYGNSEKVREIELISNNQVVGRLHHNVSHYGCWQTSHVGNEIDTIRVIEQGSEIYTENFWSNFSEQHIELI